jgi:hypothetical protein
MPRFLRMSIVGLVATLSVAATTNAGDAPAGWRYVVPAPGDTFESPPLRAIGLSIEKPEFAKPTGFLNNGFELGFASSKP